ncbi:N-acetyltransferase [Phenylobacterium sp.]|uniref:GNAT family N-acetyltransferase n=1 Tax=Phenylobacterium sp. TaxID=1871053 RepID=UPI002B590529|nr:N-acetyltransferase [Phenylobacterium sp.]HVI33667.1 N-acetyltransferase [Phenylobacterium sp.]
MIRYARPGDHPAIAAVVEAAFGQPAEARLVERLRAEEDALFELVAVEADEVVGHVLFSRLWADRYEMFAALAPLAVRPDLQNTGLGSALVRAGLESAKEFGAHGVIVLGHPAYYPRFGFSAETAAKVSSPYAGQPSFMALALEPGAFDAPMTVAYPDAFAG